MQVLFILLLVACWAAVPVHAQETTLHDPAEYLSGTMPVLYVNTVDSQPIKDKKTFIDGSYWLDPNGIEGVEAIGSADAPLALYTETGDPLALTPGNTYIGFVNSANAGLTVLN